MLETKNLCKVYKPKRGVPIKAIDDISIKFPDTGMIFLLGKSGSGKSTMLNLLGGLDKYDSGDIIISGVSSKEFKQGHFDSYRNTYVGFIFQEYNILEEFTVGANIAIAIELQGKKATDEVINGILREVDLDGYGNRNPNELSGGQRQRVAIARALVKNPRIIMADEPTGALDSNTGKQIFDTLKKLSKDKLVIVVSHDRDFAEEYADRIIELADGKVISDLEYFADITEESDDGLTYSEDTIHVPSGYHLTEKDRKEINGYIEGIKTGNIDIVIGKIKGNNIKSKPTDTSRLVLEKESEFNLIKSKLPMKNAFKIGASGLKHKKFRLVITILLSCISLGLFGLADTFGSYNHIKTCTQSIIDSGITYAAVTKSVKVNGEEDPYYNRWGHKMTDEEITSIENETGIKMNGLYYPSNYNMSFSDQYNTDEKFTQTDFHIYSTALNGFSEITQENLDNMGYKIVAGVLPDGEKNQIAISKYVCETFIKGKYRSSGTSNTFDTVSSYEEMIDKTIILGGDKYTVTAIIDTNFDMSRYEGLVQKKENESAADKLVSYSLYNELQYIRDYSLIQAAMVGDGFIERMQNNRPSVKEMSGGYISFVYEDNGNHNELHPQFVGNLDDIKDQEIIWADGEKKQLGEKEIVISSDMIMFYLGKHDREEPNGVGLDKDTTKIIEEFLKKYISFKNFSRLTTEKNDKDYKPEDGYKVVGYIDSEKYGLLRNTAICNKSIFSKYVDDGIYQYAVGPMPQSKTDIGALVSNCYREDVPIRYEMMNSVTYQLDAINDILKAVSQVFLYIGIGFAVFSSIMMANFIGTSISYKKQEIGILRAIGSRSNDVFRIFLSESFIIAMINFVLSSIGVFVATMIINFYVRSNTGILITVLSFGVRQLAFLFFVSIGVAAIASFFPVKKIASKRPIDAIRNR